MDASIFFKLYLMNALFFFYALHNYFSYFLLHQCKIVKFLVSGLLF